MGSRPSILIVESRQNTRTFLEMTLSQEGFSVFSAVNLNSALLQLRVLRPELIIVGFDQLEFDVDAAVARFKALSSSPLFVLGGSNGIAKRPGIADTLLDPFNVGELCVKVVRLLGKEPASLSRAGGE